MEGHLWKPNKYCSTSVSPPAYPPPHPHHATTHSRDFLLAGFFSSFRFIMDIGTCNLQRKNSTHSQRKTDTTRQHLSPAVSPSTIHGAFKLTHLTETLEKGIFQQRKNHSWEQNRNEGRKSLIKTHQAWTLQARGETKRFGWCSVGWRNQEPGASIPNVFSVFCVFLPKLDERGGGESMWLGDRIVHLQPHYNNATGVELISLLG